jgi:hypothetical protein
MLTDIRVAERPPVELDPSSTISPSSATVDRRRPGRPANVSPELVRLLRWKPDSRRIELEDGDAADPLGPAAGMLAAATVGLLIWGGVLLTLSALLD